MEDPQFAALVRGQATLLFRVAYTVLRHTQDAEDVVQDLFLKLYRNGSWRRIENEPAFLARSVWRLALDRRRSRRSGDPLEELPSVTASPEQATVDADAICQVKQLIATLPEELRHPLMLSAIEELNSSQIGRILDLPHATVRNRLLRARALLREKLKARQYVR